MHMSDELGMVGRKTILWMKVWFTRTRPLQEPTLPRCWGSVVHTWVRWSQQVRALSMTQLWQETDVYSSIAVSLVIDLILFDSLWNETGLEQREETETYCQHCTGCVLSWCIPSYISDIRMHLSEEPMTAEKVQRRLTSRVDNITTLGPTMLSSCSMPWIGNLKKEELYNSLLGLEMP